MRRPGIARMWIMSGKWAVAPHAKNARGRSEDSLTCVEETKSHHFNCCPLDSGLNRQDRLRFE